MPEYLSPGVYIEEVRSGPVPIEGVGTSTAGLVGQTARGPVAPKLVSSFTEFERWYGGLTDPDVSFLSWAVQGFFANGGQRAFIARVPRAGAALAQFTIDPLVVTAIGPGAFGSNIFVRVVDATQQVAGGPPRFRLTVVYYDRPPDPFVDPFDRTIPIRDRPQPRVTEDWDNLTIDPDDTSYVLTTVNSSSTLVRVGWSNGPGRPANTDFADGRLDGGDDGADEPTVADYVGTTATADDPATGLTALELIDEVAILCVPDEVRGPLAAISDLVLQQCEQLKDRFAVLQFAQGQSDIESLRIDRPSIYGAKYWPWIRVFDPRNQGVQLIPPGGHVVGIYARTDILRGVHKAPANEDVRGIMTRDLPGALGPLEFKITKEDHDIINPRGICVIRDFRADGRGIRVWGARTMADDPQWRYINVRRLFIYLEESIDQGTQFVVFEPNYEATWAIVRRSITNFLTRVWRDGALAGITPEEAFFVKCDRTTMTPDDIDNGRLICLVGVAPVKPAEFVIFRFSQKTIEAQAA